MPLNNGILCMCKDEFNCPKCGKFYEGKFYEDQLEKSKKFWITKTCTNCKTKLGISTDFKGDVVVWIK